MKKIRREHNPFRVNEHSESIEYDKAMVSPQWGSKEGNERGYNTRFGPYGSAARGWVDRSHDRDRDLSEKILREIYVTDEPSEEESASGEEIPERQHLELPKNNVTYEGLGPLRRQRSDAWLLEEISERLMAAPDIDASEIEVEVKDGEVILSGSVPDRRMKYMAEDIIEDLHGVKNLILKLRVTNNRRQRH